MRRSANGDSLRPATNQVPKFGTRFLFSPQLRVNISTIEKNRDKNNILTNVENSWNRNNNFTSCLYRDVLGHLDEKPLQRFFREKQLEFPIALFCLLGCFDSA